MEGVTSAMDDLDSSSSSSCTLPPPPPPLNVGNDKKPRRRAREVSSRYMSTPTHTSAATANTSSSPIFSHGGDHLHLASSPRVGCPPPPSSLLPIAKKHHQHANPRRFPPSSPDAVTDSELDSSSSRYGDENNPLGSVVRRSLETPLSMGILQGRAAQGTHTKKRAVVRLFSENSEHREQSSDQPPNPRTNTDPRRKPRQGTPMVSANITSANDISTPRLTSVRRSLLKSDHQPLASTTAPRRINPRPPTPARQNLFPSEVDYSSSNGNGLDDAFSDNSSSVVDFSDSETCSVSSQGGLCDSPPLPGTSTRAARSATDLRSSMPEADHLTTMSVRRMADVPTGRQEIAAEHSSSSCRASTNSLCHRSLNSALSSAQQNPLNLMNKYMNRAFIPSKPPQPPSTKQLLETRKGKKSLSSQEDVHMLRLLDNSYVQWRFINAKANAAVEARSIAAQKSLHGLQSRISELQESVGEKRVELQQLQRKERLYSTFQCQMPYLEEWTSHEEVYSSSLSGVTKALQDASIRLPITGNVKVDAGEIKDALNCAVLLLESLSPCVGRFLSNAEGIEDEVSELARLVNSEKTLVEQCASLLSEAHMLQVKECSLRSQLMQFKHTVTNETLEKPIDAIEAVTEE